MLSLARLGSFLVLAVLAAAGCRDAGDDLPTDEATGLTTHSALTADGERQYQRYVPATLGTEPAPIVVVLHGRGGSADQALGGQGRSPSSRWLDIADRDGVVLIIPDGVNAPDGKQGWNDCRADVASNPDSDDVAFIEQILDEVAQHVPVDPAAVYATGLSNGGHFALRLAIERPDLVAGVGVVAAAMPGVSECAAPTEPVAVLLMNGTVDPLLPFNGGQMASDRGLVLGASESLQPWVDLAGGQSANGPIGLPDLDTGDGSTVTKTDYAGTEPVTLYVVEGGGHTEPSRQERHRRLYLRIVGPQNNDIEMADEIWTFFRPDL